MDLFEELTWRGVVYQWTGEDALPARLRAGAVTLYQGFDPSEPSLHVGNLLGLVTLRRFARAGHRVIALVGGATGMIGDPSEKSEERRLLTPDAVATNAAGIRTQIQALVGPEVSLVDNAEWFAGVGFIDFLRDVGKHASVNVMMARDSVKGRIEGSSGISFTEFAYQLIQAFDFVHLHDTLGCELQVGGSDQFGNIVAGIDLARRMRGAQLFGLTTQLVARSDGAKMGKTAEGAVWLDRARTSPYAFYQWWVRLPDADAMSFLRLYTELDQDEVRDLEKEAVERPESRDPQRHLARELTLLVHGPDGLAAAERATEALFGGSVAGLSEQELLEIFADVPSGELPRARLGDGIAAVDAFVEAGLARSKGEARRLIEGGGASVGDRRLGTVDDRLGSGDLTSETVMVLRAGKRSFALLRFPG